MVLYGLTIEACCFRGGRGWSVSISFIYCPVSFQLVPQALQIAIEEDVEFRQGLPRDYLNYMGIVHSDKVCTHDDLRF